MPVLYAIHLHTFKVRKVKKKKKKDLKSLPLHFTVFPYLYLSSGGDGIPGALFQILKNDAVKVLHSICQQMWKTQQWPQDWKRSVFILIPKKGIAKECSNYCTIALISHASNAQKSPSQASTVLET